MLWYKQCLNRRNVKILIALFCVAGIFQGSVLLARTLTDSVYPSEIFLEFDSSVPFSVEVGAPSDMGDVDLS